MTINKIEWLQNVHYYLLIEYWLLIRSSLKRFYISATRNDTQIFDAVTFIIEGQYSCTKTKRFFVKYTLLSKH